MEVVAPVAPAQDAAQPDPSTQPTQHTAPVPVPGGKQDTLPPSNLGGLQNGKQPEAAASESDDPWAKLPPNVKLPVKVNGEVKMLTPAEARKVLSKELAADSKFSEAAQIRKQLQTLKERGQKNPDEVLEYLGIDPMAYANQKLKADIERFMQDERAKQMDPRERALMERENAIKEWEQKQAESRRAEEEKLLQAKREEFGRYVNQTIREALDAAQLPRTPAIAGRMLDEFEAFIDNGVDFDPADVAQRVEDELVGEISAVMSNPRLLARIPKEVKSAFLQAIRAEAQPPAAPTPQVQSAVPVKQAPAKPEEPAKRKSMMQAYRGLTGL